jgi:hypothetical protein
VVFLKKHQGDPPAAMVPLPPVVHAWARGAYAGVCQARTTESWRLGAVFRCVGHDPSDSTWE